MINIIICVVAAILLILLLVAFVLLSITINVESTTAEEIDKKLIELGYSNSWTGFCSEMGPTNYFGILT